MTPSFEIVGLRVHNPPLVRAGSSLLATLVIQSGLFTVVGVLLAVNDDGEYRLHLPKMNEHKRVAFRYGSNDRRIVLEAALTAYRALVSALAVPPVAKANVEAEHNNELA